MYPIIDTHFTIESGPARHEFLMAVIDPKKVITISIKKPLDDSAKALGIKMRIVGTFNFDMNGRQFMFWGIIAESKNEDCLSAIKEPLTGKIPGQNTQFVNGFYTVFSGINRGYIAPCKMSMFETFCSLRSSSNTNT